MIDSFQGEYRFLSNFWPCSVVLDGHKYGSVEHAYQAAKTIDENQRQQIRDAKTPGAAKRLGKTVTLRRDWNEIKLSTMEDLLRQKFCHIQLLEALLSTGDHELVEGNTWGDVYWGVCKGVGKNRLGWLLMKIRGELQMQRM